jgi:hypothetical protein
MTIEQAEQAEQVIPELITGVTETTKLTQYDRIHLIILGEPGSGKSRLAATARKPALVYDNDDRRESIAGIPGVYVKTVVDRDPTQPTAWQQMEQDTGVLEYEKQKGNLKIKSLVGDSLTYILKHAQNQAFKDNEGLCRKIRVNSKNYLIPQGWDVYNTTQRMIEGLLNRWFELGIDVILTAHIRKEKASDSTEENPKFTGKWTIDPWNMKMVLPKFNERWFMMDDFRVLTQPNYEFNAVTALKIGKEEQPNIEQILRKHDQACGLAAK